MPHRSLPRTSEPGARPAVGSDPVKAVTVHVGRSPAIEALLPGVDWSVLGPDGIVIRTVGDDLVISGGRPRGVRNAVYTFIEDVLGCRWWSPDAETIPGRPTLDIQDLDVVYRPPFAFRSVIAEGALKRPFAWKLRNNGAETKFDPDGESILRYLLPRAEHFVEHPEWYMYDPTDGSPEEKYTYQFGLQQLEEGSAAYETARRTRRLPFQPCLTSEGALAAATRAALARIEQEYPAMKEYPPRVLWVVQQDGGFMCRCENCTAIRELEGSDSANWVRFVNYIAAQVERSHPDVLVGMHAYLHTIKPPRTIRPRDNVLIYMAALDRDHKLSFDELPEGDYLREWCRIARQVWVWDYDANFRNYIQPHPNHLDTARTIRFCRQAGATGMRVQGALCKLGDLVSMRGYVNAHMMWNPDLDPDAVRAEFLDDTTARRVRWCNAMWNISTVSYTATAGRS